MLVTFVSQCEKKALTKTRQILDAFAPRIGQRTWQTVITQEGLQAVHKLLRERASRNTAVACHWCRSSNRTELQWIVGQRHKFDHLGRVPIHTTRKETPDFENNWDSLPLIQALTALAALLHDWGKATKCFQAKLKTAIQETSQKSKSDPLRHEWISCLLFQAFVQTAQQDIQTSSHRQVKSDLAWITQLAQGNLDENTLIARMQAQSTKTKLLPLSQLPPVASLIAWLILTHHRLPLPKKDSQTYRTWASCTPYQDFQALLANIQSDFGYANVFEDYTERLPSCFEFPHGLLSASSPWLKQLKKWAHKLEHALPKLEQALQNGSWRLLLLHCRTALILGDHFYSSQAQDGSWQGLQDLIANTDRDTQTLKQRLDEHLVHVAKNALHVVHLLPLLERGLRVAQDTPRLKRKSPKAFAWQDKAVKVLREWRLQAPHAPQRGLFVINMASTGCGKTFANAKIMRAVSSDGSSLRYILALGLRTLTLQTGDAYRTQVGLDDSELGVLIGSQAVKELHEHGQDEEQEALEAMGSESLETLLDADMDFDGELPQGLEARLSTLFKTARDRKFFHAPVLACTIDHLMPATEAQRGGKHILPYLRLLSSDLVIDEVDDFDGHDLVAIGRLIHLAGMLGRKVMLSSATIPPDLAEGYFNAYREGWRLFSASREGVKSSVSCAWVDEFKSKVTDIIDTEPAQSQQKYRILHRDFVNSRVAKLSNSAKTAVRRKGQIIECASLKTDSSEKESEETLTHRYFETMRDAIVDQHCHHHDIESETNKRVSFGVVRVAHIKTCIQLARYLLEAEWEGGIVPKIMAYHSRQVMLLRSHQEKHLDQVLKRHPGQSSHLTHPIIRAHLEQSEGDDLIFILVATPVEEIGRDHDFDWAVVEPSSYRSIIQLAGRVLRHRNTSIHTANIALMQYNLKAFLGDLQDASKTVAYHRPGYESKNYDGELKLQSHDLNILLEGSRFEQRIDAIPRIQKPDALLGQRRLPDLEHKSLGYLLTCYEANTANALQGWLSHDWWLTALPQVLTPFRSSTYQTVELYRLPEKESFAFYEKISSRHQKPEFVLRHKESFGIDADNTLSSTAQQRLWLQRDYASALESSAEVLGLSPRKAAEKFGEISISFYNDRDQLNASFAYSDQFGLRRCERHEI